MKRGLQGHLIRHPIHGESFQAFVPLPLPPDPPLVISTELSDLLERANRALGKLDGVASMLPDLSLFLYFYVRKEAVLSSQIEGTQSSLSDLLLFESNELPGVPLDDVQEVSNYVAALSYGLERIRDDFPLSSRLLREVHEVLLARGRGSDKAPGQFRTSQNWIGGTRPGDAAFVPPPPGEVNACMGALENFLHDMKERTPTLVKAALAHVQFETIHPFLDGNGRLGRLLITLLLCSEHALDGPLLYLSYYFKVRRNRYYELLQRVRIAGEWEEWLQFFLEGVHETAEQSADTAKRILRLFEEDRSTLNQFGRAAGSVLRLHHYMQKHPIFTVPMAVEETAMTPPTVNNAVTLLTKAGIVRRLGEARRNRVFAYVNYVGILSEGTEPIRNGADTVTSASIPGEAP